MHLPTRGSVREDFEMVRTGVGDDDGVDVTDGEARLTATVDQVIHDSGRACPGRRRQRLAHLRARSSHMPEARQLVRAFGPRDPGATSVTSVDASFYPFSLAVQPWTRWRRTPTNSDMVAGQTATVDFVVGCSGIKQGTSWQLC